LRVRLVSREEVWASAGVEGAWVGGCRRARHPGVVKVKGWHCTNLKLARVLLRARFAASNSSANPPRVRSTSRAGFVKVC